MKFKNSLRMCCYWIPPHEILPDFSIKLESKSTNLGCVEIAKTDHRSLLEENISCWFRQPEQGCYNFMSPDPTSSEAGGVLPVGTCT